MKKIPVGFESMKMKWTIEPDKSATSLLSAIPDGGWTFFSLNRKDTSAIITYIRPIRK